MNLKFYLQKRRFVSAACRLAPMEEALLLTECKSRSMDAMMVTRQYYLELTGSLTNVQPVEVPLRYPPFKTQVFDWDAVSDDTILVRKQSSLGGALGTLLYQRPEHQMFGVEAATRLCAWLDSSFTEIKSQTLRTEVDDGNSIDGQLGFLFIYELATGARRVFLLLAMSCLVFLSGFLSLLISFLLLFRRERCAQAGRGGGRWILLGLDADASPQAVAVLAAGASHVDTPHDGGEPAGSGETAPL